MKGMRPKRIPWTWISLWTRISACRRAYATRDVRAQTLNADSEMQLNGATALNLDFQAQGERSLLKEMKAEGRSVVNLSAPKSRANDPRSASSA